MSVIPLTLVISLCLVFTFVVFFVLEQTRGRFHSAESQAILPLEEETPRVIPAGVSKAGLRLPHRECGCVHGENSACDRCRRSVAS